ncbi:MAG: response regulator transcription factor [Lentisphaerae bacterium]|nr:response regulator transcription factor [Lentisphaerota bacterium]
MKSGGRRVGGSRSATARRRVLIVDDHPIVRAGLTHLIRGEPDLDVCGEADNASDAQQSVAEKRPDLVLLDISLQGANGIELTKTIAVHFPELPILVLSMHDEHLYAERALRAGARGYVMKQEATGTLLRAIRKVLDGGLFVSDGIATRMLKTYVSEGSAERSRRGVESLSDRELEVFELIGRGVPTREIARRLRLSVKTVETYRTHIKNKLNISNAAELVQRAVRWLAEAEN